MNVYILYDPDNSISVYASLRAAMNELPSEFGWVHYPQLEQWVCADDDGWRIVMHEVYDDGSSEVAND